MSTHIGGGSDLQKGIPDGEGVDRLPMLEIFGEKCFGTAGYCGCNNQTIVIPETVASVDGDGFCQNDFAGKYSATGPKLERYIIRQILGLQGDFKPMQGYGGEFLNDLPAHKPPGTVKKLLRFPLLRWRVGIEAVDQNIGV
jgi:hypothetical protein